MVVCTEERVCGFMRKRGDLLAVAARRKGAFLHLDCTGLFVSFTHTTLTSVELILDNFIVTPVFSGAVKTQPVFLGRCKFKCRKLPEKCFSTEAEFCTAAVASKLNSRSLAPAWIPGLLGI